MAQPRLSAAQSNPSLSALARLNPEPEGFDENGINDLQPFVKPSKWPISAECVPIPARSDQLILEVHDNGKGINKHQVSNTKSLGLVGMKERAMLLGGDFRVVGTQGKGTSVTVRVPMTPRATTAPVPE